jgi:general secretion pathway protein F
MAFTVRCLDPVGRVVEHSVDAATADEARQRVAQPGWAVLGVRSQWRPSLRRNDTLDAVQFARELAALLQAGLSLLEALSIVAERQPREGVRLRLRAVHDRLAEGQRLSAALDASPGLLPLFFVASVRAAETTGQLPEALQRFVAYQSRVDALRARLSQALLYPAVVASVGALVVAFLLGYVVPRFSAIFADLRVDLPWGSRVLLGLGGFIDAHGAVLGIVLLAVLALAVVALADPSTRGALQSRLLDLPGIRASHRVYRLAIFYRNLAMLLQGGMPLPAALEMAAPTLGEVLAPQALAVRSALHDGVGPAQALDQHGLTTAESRRMLQVAERTGRLPAMLESVADFHDAEVARTVERFGRLFEPLVMVLLGAVIGTVVVMLYMPIFDLAGAIN